MVKNTTGGNKTKKQKRNFGKYDAIEKVQGDQMFAQVIHNNGGSFDISCSDGITRKGRLAGYLKNGPRIKPGSYVVISLRDFETEQKNCDIIGYGDPPNDIISLFSKGDAKNNKKGEINFTDNNDLFNDMNETNNTVNIKESKETVETKFDLDDLI